RPQCFRAIPEVQDQRLKRLEMEAHVIQEAPSPARHDVSIPPVGFIRWRSSRRHQRMRKNVSQRRMYPIDALLFRPLADLQRLLKRVPRRVERRERITQVERAELHLKMKILANGLADRPYNLQEKARAIFEGTAVLVL